ncbi:MAG: hypothetical protein BWY70_01263 [Bacteroidetes bacterium ADurb.Bin408]|nr:MAG: hypothetical protein BWY70_01263 [Bacteroidetes bacterium ADurb.Bin408]
MKKVLIITYYWPPTGGVGVQRWLKFSKYLRNFGWEPVIYTVLNPGGTETDSSTLNDIPENALVLKEKIWEPYAFYNKLTGKSKNEKIATGFLNENKRQSVLQKMAVWLRGNFFIPDARMFFIKPSVRYLSAFLASEKIDAIVSTGTPHSMHLIALALKKKFNLPWLADFRDSWRLNDYYNKLMLTRFADARHKKLERNVLENADAITTVSPFLKKYFDQLGFENTEVITNGFDSADYAPEEKGINEYFTVCHTGSLNNDRNHEALWAALNELCTENPAFRAKLQFMQIGHTDFEVRKSIEQHYLTQYCHILKHTTHDEVVKHQNNAGLLLLIINNTPDAKGRITYKLFEYLASGNPILCIGPVDGDAAAIIKDSGCGFTADYYDKNGIKTYLSDIFQKYLYNQPVSKHNHINHYKMDFLTGKIAAILDRISGK